MTKIRFASPEDTPITHAKDVVTAKQAEYLGADGLATDVRFYHPGSETELQMFEVTVVPNLKEQQHSHDEPEIIYVLKGQMIVGRRVLNPGASVYIAGNTLYSFSSGPEGLTFLNFRPRQDLTYYSKEEHLARQAAEKISA